MQNNCITDLLNIQGVKVKDIKNNENSLNVLYELILLDSDVDYYVLKSNNVIASAEENKIDSEALKNIKKLWETLEGDIKNWETTTHNPIKEIEHNKQIGKIALNIIFVLLYLLFLFFILSAFITTSLAIYYSFSILILA